MNRFTWNSGESGRLSLTLTMGEAESCSHSGRCDDDVAWLLDQPHIQAQANDWDERTLRDELRGYGAWDEAELADHSQNVARMLWIACCDVAEEPEIYLDEPEPMEA